MSKHEIAAALCRVGIEAGFWSVPEFEIFGRTGNGRKIDVVWARRIPRGSRRLWRPIAAFEIEGHDVDLESIRKNADSLTAAGNAGSIVRAMILFQVGPDGSAWHPRSRPRSKESSLKRAEAILKESLEKSGSPYSAEVLLDEQLCERCEVWVQLGTSQPAIP